jgi:hypothetical protein
MQKFSAHSISTQFPMEKSKITTPVVVGADHQAEIEKHLKAAKQADLVAKHHREAAKHFEEGNAEMAHEAATHASTLSIIESSSPNDDPKQHAAM